MHKTDVELIWEAYSSEQTAQPAVIKQLLNSLGVKVTDHEELGFSARADIKDVCGVLQIEVPYNRMSEEEYADRAINRGKGCDPRFDTVVIKIESRFGQLLFAKLNSLGWEVNGMMYYDEDGEVPYGQFEFTVDKIIEVKSEFTKGFHVTLLSSAKKIISNGIIPREGSRSGFSYSPRSFLFAEIGEKEIEIIQNLQSAYRSSTMGPDFTPPKIYKPICILKVQIPPDIETFEDTSSGPNAFYVTKPIPPNNLEIVYHGPLLEMPKSFEL